MALILKNSTHCEFFKTNKNSVEKKCLSMQTQHMKTNLVCFINICIYAVLYHFFHKQRMRLVTYLYQREILHY